MHLQQKKQGKLFLVSFFYQSCHGGGAKFCILPWAHQNLLAGLAAPPPPNNEAGGTLPPPKLHKFLSWNLVTYVFTFMLCARSESM